MENTALAATMTTTISKSRTIESITPFRRSSEVRDATEAVLTGAPPDWLRGDLVRTCPAVFQAAAWRARHWFDGLGMIYAFRIGAGSIAFQSRLLESEAANQIASGPTRLSSFGTPTGRTAWQRIEGTERPLATSEADVERLLDERLPLYEELADAVVPMADEGVVARALPAIQALSEMPEGTRLLWASSASGDYPVFVGRDLLGTEWWPLEGRRFCVTDLNAGIYAEQLTELNAVIQIPAGERSKTLDQVRDTIRVLAEEEMTREDHVVALGGGVVGDLAGFCAHVYQRGVPVVQVPTTLVAQVDSAHGGKTGVDVEMLKNYAGAYHLPAAVFADTQTLTSLPNQELAAGFVEVVKTGLLAGGQLWERVRLMESLDPNCLDDVIFACARYKCAVVAADERDGGLRHVLNLGHTVGHAIESVSDFSYLHGEAIGLGLLAALRLSEATELRDEVEAILTRVDLPFRLDPRFDIDEILEILQHDKKRTAAGVGFVLLSEPGKPRTGQIVDEAKVREAVDELY